MSEKLKNLNILFLTPRLPYPLIGGDRLKPYNILKHLAADNNVTLVSLNQGGMPHQGYIDAIEKYGIEVFVIPFSPIAAGIKSLITTVSNGYPLEIGYYTQTRFRKTVNNLLSKRDWDVGFSFFMRTAEYLKKKKRLKKILMAEDCRTLYQKRSYEQSQSIKQKIVRYWEYLKLQRYEPRIVNHFDVTTLVTYEDISAMQQQNAMAKYALLSNGVDINKFVPSIEVSERSGLLFSGKLDVWANQMMVQNIVQNIFPKILQQRPDTILHIVGANPPGSIMALQSDKIKVTANVPDMIPFLQQARVFLHPHAGGSGIQNKLLEAMSCGCPVVTTQTGIQGISARDQHDVLLGQTQNQLAQHAIALLNDKALAETISRNCRKLIVNTHSWDAIFDATDEIIRSVIEME